MKENKWDMRRRRAPFIKQFFYKNRILFCVSLISSAVSHCINLATVWSQQNAVDILSGNSTKSLINVVFIYVGLLLGCLLLGVIYQHVEPKFSACAIKQYKDYAFSELTKKSIGTFSNENTARYISMLTNDIQSIQEGYLETTFALIKHIILFTGALLLMLYYSPLLTAIAIALSFIPLILSLRMGNKASVKEREVSEKNEEYVGGVKDWLTGFSVIKSFKAEVQVINCFKRENACLEDTKRKRDSAFECVNLFSTYASLLSQTGTFFIGCFLALNGKGVTIGQAFAFLNLTAFILVPIQNVPYLLGLRKAAIALIDKLASLLAENVRKEGEKIPAKLTDGIAFEGVSFAYEEGKPVLQNVSQRFEAGKSYAIVGASGSGKSTLLNLLLGSTDAYEGEICFDGKELRGIDEDSLYELMTPVQQNVFVFNDTIRNNVTMFREFSDEQVERAIRLSGLSKLIEERGEDYVCGENGNGLSGGERQRISIARAILRGAPVLLVDEATAALDADTASAVTGAILDIDSLTRIVVTHRLEAALLARYDEILVMKNGNICEKGTFANLMEQKGMFYSLFMIASSSAFA